MTYRSGPKDASILMIRNVLMWQSDKSMLILYKCPMVTNRLWHSHDSEDVDVVE